MIVFDLDGTIADDSHRNYLLLQRPKKWDEYYNLCHLDKPVWPIIKLARALHRNGNRIEIWTGRREDQRQKTTEWLANCFMPYQKLRMRPVNNYEDASELKGRWLEEGRRPCIVFDDRRRAVEWWREQGITCLAVADNDY